jgi:hypothetical protein
LSSRTLTRAFVVCSVLLFALEGRLTQGVRTAYGSGWTASRGCTKCRLPDAGWIWAHTAATVLLALSLLAALGLWWMRRRRELPEETLEERKEAHEPLLRLAVGFGACALSASAVAAVLTYLGDHDHRGLVTLASGLELAALALLAATGFLLASTSRPGARGPSTADFVVWIRRFLQRQRITLIAVSFLALIMLGVGQTSGQAVDSMRVWTEFGDDRSLARLSFGIASSLLLALVIYEGGMRLARVELSGSQRKSVRARWWFVAGAGVVAAWLILYFSLHRSLGWGLLSCAGILLALGVLELGRAEGNAPEGFDVGAHEGAVEFLAVVPMLTFAVVAVSAAVDSGLAGGSGWEALRVFSPGALLAVFAVLMTAESRYETSPRPWWIWLLGGALFLLATGLLITFRVEGWGISSAVGFALCVLAAAYAISVFRWRRVPLLGPLGGWQLAIPVALATGLTTFLLVHVDPEGFGQTLGSFALLNLSLAFILAWLPWVIGWSLERRPPRVLWALGFQQLPLVLLVALAWILAGVVKPPGSLHDVRLVDHQSDLARPTLNEVFRSWENAQAEFRDPKPGPPVPLVLVAAHGGGIKAAYWTALVLDCIVGVSPAGFDGTHPQEADTQTCRATRRDASDQQRAARRIFLISSVSGGAIGMYAYARQMLAEGSLGTEADNSSGSWVNRRLARDFVSPTIAWGLFHDVPNHILGLHPRERGVCAWHFFDPCATMDRGTVLERSFDGAFNDVKGADPTLRGTWEARQSSERAKAVPLLVGNATVSGGKARAVISAADLGAWPSLEGSPPPGGDPRPLAGTVEVGDTLCSSNDLRLSTASLLAGHFPYVSPSAHLEALCGARDGKVEARDRESNCARIDDPGICELNLVDGGYAENSGLFTIVALWPALNRLVMEHNRSSPRKIALVIVEIDNHYRPRVRDVPRGSGGKSETLIPPATAFGAHNAAEAYARAAAQRVTGAGCTLTISPRLHPGLVAPLGWELSEGARDDLQRGLVEPRPNATGEQRLAPVLDLRRLQGWLGGEQVQGLDTSLQSCVPS